MTPPEPQQHHAARARWNRPEHVEIRVNKVAQHIRRLVATAPPLTEDQIIRLVEAMYTNDDD